MASAVQHSAKLCVTCWPDVGCETYRYMLAKCSLFIHRPKLPTSPLPPPPSRFWCYGSSIHSGSTHLCPPVSKTVSRLWGVRWSLLTKPGVSGRHSPYVDHMPKILPTQIPARWGLGIPMPRNPGVCHAGVDWSTILRWSARNTRLG